MIPERITIPDDPHERAAAARAAAARFVGGFCRPQDRRWVLWVFEADQLGALADLCKGVEGLPDQLSAILLVAATAERDTFSVAGTVFSHDMLADAASMLWVMLAEGELGRAAEFAADLAVGSSINLSAEPLPELVEIADRCLGKRRPSP